MQNSAEDVDILLSLVVNDKQTDSARGRRWCMCRRGCRCTLRCRSITRRSPFWEVLNACINHL